MRLSVRFCVAVVAALSVVVAVEHVEAREISNNDRNFVSPRLPERLTRLPYSHISSDAQRRQRPRQHIHSRPYTQEGLDERTAYLASQRLVSRYHFSRGQADTKNAHTVATIRHEPRVEQHVRISITEPPIIQGSTHDPAASASRTHTTGDESYSRVHQMGPYTTHERRRHPYARDSYDSRNRSASRDRLYGIPEQHAGIDNKVSHGDDRMNHTSLAAGIGEQVQNALLATSIRPERPSHNRHMAPTTRTLSSLTREPSVTLTSGLSRELDAADKHPSKANDESENDLQLQDWPDRCCGSRVPFDPRTGTPTGAFQRVAAAGSLKVVRVPAQDSFPPSEVRDLVATPLDPHTLSLTWTAPGGDLDSGTASGYIIRLSVTRHDLQESQFDAAPEDTVLRTSEALTEAGVYQPAGTRVGVEVPLARPLQRGHIYYVAFRALDDNGHSRSTQDSEEECEPLYSLPSQEEPVRLCQAHRSLALAITYLIQNNEHHYLDYLSAALHSLEQKMQPSWRAETRRPQGQ
ncbi:uncharacterized protein LOC123510430 isoform X2 [Portunus trituberculatus]|uniref:uncharacterized protein LOC123510430 isoform X2 n=1 Tax=Portunus trituberculatus TaxID=210409 RepID=UPI001E1D0858|nr:uncharacterized protein LOC123510430 isoform X2 [Portunus trituberculatus]